MLRFEDFEKLALTKKEIKHKKEIVDGELIHIFSYMISTPELFRNEIERECRGITFDNKGNILCRPFHKFFNIGEREETLPENIIWGAITIVTPKIDGSLLTPVLINGKIFWKTKKTFYSEVALEVQKAWNNKETWVRKHEKMIYDSILNNETPIFEFTSQFNKVVIDYGEEKKLTLLCTRHNFSGQYWIPSEFKDKKLTEEIMSMRFSYKHFLERIKEMKDIEGFCLYSIDSQIYKIKTEWYMDLHRTLQNISYKEAFRLIAEEKIDDIISALRLNDKRSQIIQIEKLINEFNDEYFQLSRAVDNAYSLAMIELGDAITKKMLASYVKSNCPELSSFMFKKYDDFLLDEALRKKVFEKLSNKYKGEILFMGFENNGKNNIK